MKILESEVYTGDLVQGKTKMVDHQQVTADDDNLIIARHTHEPIISHELFTAVQEYRKQVCEESRAVPKRPYTPNIFKGKAVLRRLRQKPPPAAGRAQERPGYLLVPLSHEQPCSQRYLQRRDDAGDRADCTVSAILEKELSVALGMSLPLFQLEARQKQKKDGLKSQMSAKRQDIEKQRRLIRGLYENFVQGIFNQRGIF